MERGLINDEQRAQIEAMLQQENAPEGGEEAISQNQAQEALQEGAQMAQADLQAAAATNDSSGNSGANSTGGLQELGFGSVEELVQQYKALMAEAQTQKEMLTQLTALQQAAENAEDLDPNDPNSAIKKVVRDELEPLIKDMKAKARNRVVQDAWSKSAADKPDIQEIMPEIQQFIREHPELSVAEDGLSRAYDAVRSKKYRSEDSLLNDSEFIRKAAGNEKIKNAVIEAYLQEVAKSGENVPESIAEGGGVPLTGRKQKPKTFGEAKNTLVNLLSRG